MSNPYREKQEVEPLPPTPSRLHFFIDPKKRCIPSLPDYSPDDWITIIYDPPLKSANQRLDRIESCGSHSSQLFKRIEEILGSLPEYLPSATPLEITASAEFYQSYKQELEKLQRETTKYGENQHSVVTVKIQEIFTRIHPLPRGISSGFTYEI